MRRISDEDGREASARNVGRLALSVIPAAFGGAALLWVIASAGYVDLTKSIRAERRVMESVGIVSVPVRPIVFETHDARCLKIDSAFMRDGDHFVFYSKNTCAGWMKKPSYYYRLLSADGTTLDSHTWLYDGETQIAPGERREQTTWLKDGVARVERIRVEVID